MDVNKGVAITIENIDGKGAITNAGSVTIEKGTIEGPITFENGDAQADNMVKVDEDGKTTLTGGVAGSGTIDKLAIDEEGKTTIANAKLSGHEGRALLNSGMLTVNDGSFDGNKAGNGGAIYNATNATLKITGTSFTNNTATGWGGAILNSGATITVTDARFENNIARGGAGGAIGNPAEGPSSVTISGTKFLNNHSVYDGGAIGNYGGMKIENCLFEGNTAQLDFDGENGTWTKSVTDSLDVGGGAISLGAVSDSAVASISGTTFKNNISGKNGGAIATRQAAHADNSAAKLDIAATFIGNKAQQGGAIYNSFYTDNGLNKGAGVTVTGTFSVNEATGKGGAIYNDGTLDKAGRKGGIMTITDATFDGNKADFGGAIFNTGTLTINGGSFEGNTATKAAGAIYNAADAKLTVDGVTFASNSSAIAGAINNSDGTVTIKNSTFKGNTALVGDAQQGGAITNADQMTITGSTFEGNQAGKLGGAIYNAGNLTLNNSTFTGNSATGEHAHGGAIFNAGTITFTGSNTFSGNMAGGEANDIFNAGTITVANGTTTLDSGLSLAAGSTTTVNGGALVVNGITEWKTQGVDEGKNLGSLKVNGGALTLQKGDVLVSNADQVSVKDGINLSVTDGSSLYLINKDNYTAENFTAAKKTLTEKGALKTDASFGFVGGTLVGAEDNKATDLVVSGNGITGDTTFTTVGLESTKVGNSSFLQNDLKVDAVTAPNVAIEGANVAVNKVKIEASADAGKTLTITSNGSLTVVGGNANDQLIATNGNDLTTITVDSGKLNLGSAAMPDRGAGTLGTAQIKLDGELNASNGDYTVGDVVKASTGGTITANTGANLNTGKIDANAVTADAANIKATDDVTAGGINLAKGGSVTSEKSITVNVSSIEDADGTLQAGGNITATDKDLKQAAGGKLTVVAGGTIKAAGITATNVAAKKLTASGDVAVDGGELNLTGTGTDASTVKNLKLTNGTQATVADLKLTGAGTDKTLTVGTGDDTAGGTTLSAQHIDLNGGMLLVDPAWGQASSNVAVESLSAGDVGVGQNSYLALGTADTGWLPGVVGNYTKGVGLSETGITAALGVYKGLTIGTGKALLVDGSKMDTATDPALTNAVNAAADDSATFADNSLLVVNGADEAIAAGGAAISFEAPGTLTVSEGAKLLVTDAVAGQTYTIVGNVAAGSTVDGWKNNGMTSTTDMISLGDAVFTLDTGATTGKVTTSATRNDAHTVFPNLSDGMANAVNDLYTGHAGAAGQPNWDYADVNSADMGVRFLSRATDNRFLGMDKEAAAATIESAARIAFAGAVPQMTKMASDAGTNAVVNRLGFADPADGAQAMDADGKIVDRNTTGFALWIAPLWQSQHGWGMDADSMDYGFNGNLGGVSLGADYTFENAIRAGITFNIGGGYAESSGGDLSSTDNRMNFWGLGAYAGWNYENFGVMADVSYTSTWNQLKQDVDSRMGMGDLEADVQATAISAGLRAEYLLQTSAMDIIPHIGVRYMSLNTWGYDVDTHGGTVLEGDSLHQDIWTFPIGVTFSKDFALDSGWNFKPSIDFSVIPAAGDIKAKQDVAFTGLPGSYEVETQMMDYLTWQGGVGLEMGNDTMSFGVNYTLQAGQHTTGHGVFGSFRYEF
ncbi:MULTISPECIES: autotransporter domain-containing protein [Desulfovibrio]|nr:autotransporter domain-containing protein [Desulfovibrio piger]